MLSRRCTNEEEEVHRLIVIRVKGNALSRDTQSDEDLIYTGAFSVSNGNAMSNSGGLLILTRDYRMLEALQIHD